MTQVEPRPTLYGAPVPPIPAPRPINENMGSVATADGVPYPGYPARGMDQQGDGAPDAGMPTADGGWDYQVYTPQSETDNLGNAPEMDLSHPEEYFESIVADPRLTTDKKLLIIEATRLRILEAADSKLQREEAGAEYIKSRANQQAEEDKERVRHDNTALTEQARERAAQEKAAAQIKSEALKTAAEGQIQVAQYHRKNIEEDLAKRMAKASLNTGVEPGMWPEPLEQAILGFNPDKYRKTRYNQAAGIVKAAEKEAARILDEAERTGSRQLDRVMASIEGMLSAQYQRARLMVEAAKTEHGRVFATVEEAVERAQDQVRLEANEQRRRETDPTLTVVRPQGSFHSVSVPISIDRLPKTTGSTGGRRTTTADRQRTAMETEDGQALSAFDAEPSDEGSEYQAHRGRLPRFLKARTAVIAGGAAVAVSLGVVGTGALESGKSGKATIELQIEQDSRAPQWATSSLKAWQGIITQTSEDPRIADGKNNYFAPENALGDGQEKMLYALMALTSQGDPKYEGGVVFLDPSVLQKAAKEMGVNYDPNKTDLTADPKLSFLLGERALNDQMTSMLSDPAKLQTYRQNRNQFYTDFATAYATTLTANMFAKDAQGQPNPQSNADVSNFAKLFTDLVNGSSATQTSKFKDVYQTYQSYFDTAAKNLQAIGLLPK